jgi:hypothetical protein
MAFAHDSETAANRLDAEITEERQMNLADDKLIDASSALANAKATGTLTSADAAYIKAAAAGAGLDLTSQFASAGLNNPGATVNLDQQNVTGLSLNDSVNAISTAIDGQDRKFQNAETMNKVVMNKDASDYQQAATDAHGMEEIYKQTIQALAIKP